MEEKPDTESADYGETFEVKRLAPPVKRRYAVFAGLIALGFCFSAAMCLITRQPAGAAILLSSGALTALAAVLAARRIREERKKACSGAPYLVLDAEGLTAALRGGTRRFAWRETERYRLYDDRRREVSDAALMIGMFSLVTLAGGGRGQRADTMLPGSLVLYLKSGETAEIPLPFSDRTGFPVDRGVTEIWKAIEHYRRISEASGTTEPDPRTAG